MCHMLFRTMHVLKYCDQIIVKCDSYYKSKIIRNSKMDNIFLGSCMCYGIRNGSTVQCLSTREYHANLITCLLILSMQLKGLITSLLIIGMQFKGLPTCIYTIQQLAIVHIAAFTLPGALL